MAPERSQRVDARRNYDRLVQAAADVVAEQGANASLRDVARRAGVGLGTLYRHFPTRDSLLEVLLASSFEQLSADALSLAERPADEALTEWLRVFVARASQYKGVSEALMASLSDESSPLFASCAAMRAAGTRLLQRAQAEGTARADFDGTDLFSLAMTLSWAHCNAPTRARGKRLVEAILRSVFEAPRARR